MAKAPMDDRARERALAQLDRLYARLDEAGLRCRGLCHDACTVIDASELERERIRARGVELGPPVGHRRHLELIAAGQHQRCPALGPLNTCTVYEVRPLICRLFGVAEGLFCEHGCVPEQALTKSAAHRLLIEVAELSRSVTGRGRRAPEVVTDA